jgi:thiosulfate/3-mercaptopyruvate sulfurtransferase
MNEFTTLVSAQDVLRHPEWRLVDCRHDLSQPALGAQRFAEGHPPGAVHAHLDEDLSGPKDGSNGRHPLPRRQAFLDWLETQGLTGDEQIVAFDDAGGAYAARLWWLLRWVGHSAVAVLDGGVDAWKAAGGVMTQDVHQPARTRYRPKSAGELARVVDVRFVEGNLRTHEALVLDARGAGRYAGVGETIDPVGGHIPGAANRSYLDNLANGLFKPGGMLRAEFDKVLGAYRPEQVVAQCGSGVTACHNLLAMEVAGLGGARLYPGSWSEWCSDPTRPVATGDAA